MPTETEIKKTEAQIQREIMDGNKAHFPGVHLFRVLSGQIMKRSHGVVHGAPAGTPDLCGWLPDGRFFGVEVKTKVGTFSREQYELIGKAAKAGAVIITASSWEDYAHQVHGLCHEAELKDTKRYEEIENEKD